MHVRTFLVENLEPTQCNAAPNRSGSEPFGRFNPLQFVLSLSSSSLRGAVVQSRIIESLPLLTHIGVDGALNPWTSTCSALRRCLGIFLKR